MIKFISMEKMIAAKWSKLKPGLKSAYGSKAKFLEARLGCGLFKDWIEGIRDVSLTRSEMNSIAHSMVKYIGVKHSEIHTRLAMMCHQQNVDLPEVHGCLTAEYWESYFSTKKVSQL